MRCRIRGTHTCTRIILREVLSACVGSAVLLVSIPTSAHALAPQSVFSARDKNPKEILAGNIPAAFWFGEAKNKIYEALNIKGEIKIDPDKDEEEQLLDLKRRLGLGDQDVILVTTHELPQGNTNFARIALRVSPIGRLLGVRAKGPLLLNWWFEITAQPAPTISLEAIYLDPLLRDKRLAGGLMNAWEILLADYFPGYAMTTHATHVFTMRKYLQHYQADLDFDFPYKQVYTAPTMERLGALGLLDKQTASRKYVPRDEVYQILKEKWAPRGNGNALRGILLHLSQIADKRGEAHVRETVSELGGFYLRGAVPRTPTQQEELEARQFVQSRPEYWRGIQPYSFLTERYGYKPWKDLYAVAQPWGDFFFGGKGMMSLEMHFSREELLEKWPDLVRMAVAGGPGFGIYAFGAIVPKVKALFPDDFDFYWPGIVQITVAEKQNASDFIQHTLPGLLREPRRQWWPHIVEASVTVAPHASELFHHALDPFQAEIKEPGDLSRRAKELGNLLAYVPGVEDKVLTFIGDLKPLLMEYPEAWKLLIVPTIRSARIGSLWVLWLIKKIHEAGTIRSAADLDVLRAISTRKGVRTLDLLETFIVKGVRENIVQLPLSSEGHLLLEFLAHGNVHILEMYRQFKALHARKLSPAAIQRWLEIEFKKLEGLRRRIVRGEVLPSQRIRPYLGAMLMDVFPPATTDTREDYERIFNTFEDYHYHIPQNLHKRLRKIPIVVPSGQYVLKPGAVMDVSAWGIWREVLEEENARELSFVDIAELGRNLLAKQGGRKNVLRDLYRHFRHTRTTHLPQEASDYRDIVVQEKFLGDTLRDLVGEALAAYKSAEPQGWEESVRGVTRPTASIEGIARKVYAVVAGVQRKKLTDEQAMGILSRMLQPLKMDAKALWPHMSGARSAVDLEPLLGDAKDSGSIRRTDMARSIAGDLVRKEYKAIMRDLEKWEYRAGAGTKVLRAVVSKRKAHAVARLSMGVCTAHDYASWSNPDFMQVILWDEDDVARGGMQLLIVEDSGKSYLSLPGIDPNMGPADETSPKILYDQLIALAQDIAAAMDLEPEILIPKAPEIHSMDKGIRAAIQEAKYAERALELPQQLSFEPPYVFQDVYVVPPKTEAKSMSLGMQKFATAGDYVGTSL